MTVSSYYSGDRIVRLAFSKIEDISSHDPERLKHPLDVWCSTKLKKSLKDLVCQYYKNK